MSTKVKGEAIKEGSIPLSALATEVRAKIENVGGGADWNAQGGESGYIKNKPFGFTKVIRLKELNPTYYYDEDENEICEAIIPLVDSFDVYTTTYQVAGTQDYPIGYDYFKIKPGVEFQYGITRYTNSVSYSLEAIDSGEYIEGYKIKFISSSIDSYSDFEYCVFIVDTYNGKGCVTISDNFIPNTIVKTTPQALSDTDKNQALANLGIDPIVLKYLCDPYIACVEGIEEDIEEVPEDLRSIIIKDDALLDIVLNLVYFKDMSDSDEPIYKPKGKNYDKIICDNFTVTYNYSTNKFYKYYD